MEYVTLNDSIQHTHSHARKNMIFQLAGDLMALHKAHFYLFQYRHLTLSNGFAGFKLRNYITLELSLKYENKY